MKTELKEAVQYTLRLGEHDVLMNELVGRKIQLRFANEIYCLECGKKTRKSFGEGFCYPCFAESPNNSPCIIRPELCTSHMGTGRCVPMSNGHNIEHFVYLAASSSVKVGVTRSSNIVHRWMDQGASSAIRFATLPYRQLAGELEVALKAHLTDKTSWQKMLKNEVGVFDLLAEKNRISEVVPERFRQYINEENEILTINYPVTRYPVKVKSCSFDKMPEISGVLEGIKGQYLLMDQDRVVNIRSHSGYLVELEHF